MRVKSKATTGDKYETDKINNFKQAVFEIEWSELTNFSSPWNHHGDGDRSKLIKKIK